MSPGRERCASEHRPRLASSSAAAGGPVVSTVPIARAGVELDQVREPNAPRSNTPVVAHLKNRCETGAAPSLPPYYNIHVYIHCLT